MSDDVAPIAEAVEPTGLVAAPESNPPPGKRPEQGHQGHQGQRKKKNAGKHPRQQQDRRPPIDLGLTPRPRQRPSDQGRRIPGVKTSREISREKSLEFLPIATHPAERVSVKAQTEYTKKLYLDHYGRAQISLYNLMVFLPIQMRQHGIPDEKVWAFQDALHLQMLERIRNVAKRISSETARAKKLASDNSVTAIRIYSKDALDASLPKLTTHIGALLNLLPVFDQYVALVDALLIEGYFLPSQRDRSVNGFRNEIVMLIRQFMHLYHESKRLCDKGADAPFERLLAAPAEAVVLPEALDAADEVLARELVGAPAPADEPVADAA